MIQGTVYKIVDADGQCVYVGSTMQMLHSQMQEHEHWIRNTPISCTIHAATNNYMAHPFQIDVFDSIQAI